PLRPPEPERPVAPLGGGGERRRASAPGLDEDRQRRRRRRRRGQRLALRSRGTGGVPRAAAAHRGPPRGRARATGPPLPRAVRGPVRHQDLRDPRRRVLPRARRAVAPPDRGGRVSLVRLRPAPYTFRRP